jgi:hypothetical protein
MKISSQRAIYATCCGLAALSVMASAAAADPASASIPSNGLMQFPNVQVMTAATPIKTADSATGNAASARAYKDHETGKLRGPTPAELLAESLLEAAPTEPQARAIFPSSSGGMIAELGDSGLVYMVATKDDSGAVSADCITDAKTDAEALATANAEKGDSHDH